MPAGENAPVCQHMVLHHSIIDVESHAADDAFGVTTRGLPRARDAHIVHKHTWLQVNTDHPGRTIIIHPSRDPYASTSIMIGSVPPGADLSGIFAHNEAYRER